MSKVPPFVSTMDMTTRLAFFKLSHVVFLCLFTFTLGINLKATTSENQIIPISSCALVCPDDITVYTTGTCDQTVVFNTATYVDANQCAGSIGLDTGSLPSGSTFEVGEHEVTFISTSPAGVEAQCTFNIQVLDDEAPILSCSDQTVTVETGLAVDIDPTLFTSVTDNCSDAGVMLNFYDPNGGWIDESSAVNRRLNKVHFETPQIGWIVGNRGKVQKTINGGKDWVLINDAGIPDNHLYDVYFQNESKGWIAGRQKTFITSHDGGASWTSVPITFPNNTHLWKTYFVDENNGWLVGSKNQFKKTIDGGLTWINQSQTGINSMNTKKDVYFKSPNEGWVIGANNRIYYTSNGGSNWSLQTTPIGGHTLHRLSVVSDGNGGEIIWVAGNYGTLLQSIDGTTWTNISNPVPSDKNIMDVSFYDASAGFIVAQGGHVYHTIDGGLTWTAPFTAPSHVF